MYLKIQGVEKYYGEKEARVHVLKGVTCEIAKSDICVLLGPSGCGKSTLLNLIGGIEKVDDGSLIINHEDIGAMNQKQLSLYRRHTLGFIFQFYHLVPNLTVKENIESGAYLSKEPLSVDELLEDLGLMEHKNKYPNQLSGGQQQRTAIGRALAKHPTLLLCDEPTGALDYTTSKDILKLLEDINRKYHTTILIVTHNDALKYMAHRVLWMKDGQIVKTTCNEKRITADELEW